MLIKPFKMRGNEDASRIPSQVHTTQQATMNTTYLDIMALSITPPSPLAGCWWWEDWLKAKLAKTPPALQIGATTLTAKDAFTGFFCWFVVLFFFKN